MIGNGKVEHGMVWYDTIMQANSSRLHRSLKFPRDLRCPSDLD